MQENNKTKEQLINELAEPIRRTEELEKEISERKRVEKVLQIERDNFSNILETMNDGIYIVDRQYDIRYVNPVFKKDFGSYEGKKCYAYFHNRTAVCPWCKNQEVLAGKTIRWEFHFSRNQRTYDIISTPLKNPDDGVSILEILRDITERKQTEEALRQSKDLFHSLIEALPQNIFSKDLEGRFTFANQRYCMTQGQSLADIIGKTDFDINPPELAKKYQEDDRRVIETGQIFETVEDHQPLGGEKFYVQVIKTPMYDSNEQITGILGIFWDITERKQAEAQLKEYSERLEEMVAERTKELREAQEELVRKERLTLLGHFSGSISHELRNPLGVIDSSVYYLKMKLGDSDEKVGQHLERIKASVSSATAIVQSLLNLTRMKKPDAEPHDLIVIVSESLGSSKIPDTVAVERHFPDTEIPVKVEREQIRMALKNIVKNAVKAMEGAGTLSVTIRKTENGQVELIAKDTGPGIQPEDLEKVFQPLFSTKVQGIGFGLSITKMITENHGGTIKAESEPGKGAAFIITLPLLEEGDQEDE